MVFNSKGCFSLKNTLCWDRKHISCFRCSLYQAIPTSSIENLLGGVLFDLGYRQSNKHGNPYICVDQRLTRITATARTSKRLYTLKVKRLAGLIILLSCSRPEGSVCWKVSEGPKWLMLRLSDSISGTACREPLVVGLLLHLRMLTNAISVCSVSRVAWKPLLVCFWMHKRKWCWGQWRAHHTTTPKNQKRRILNEG